METINRNINQEDNQKENSENSCYTSVVNYKQNTKEPISQLKQALFAVTENRNDWTLLKTKDDEH